MRNIVIILIASTVMLFGVVSSANDAELKKQVEVFLVNRQSEKAVEVAQQIEDPNLRNTVLLDILRRQCKAAGDWAHEFEMMLGKAKDTAQFLTGDSKNTGYAEIARIYYQARRFDLAVEALKNISAERCEQYLVDSSGSGYFRITSPVISTIPGWNTMYARNTNVHREPIRTLEGAWQFRVVGQFLYFPFLRFFLQVFGVLHR
ncbi:MAG: hypothetical protein FWE95_08200 [Planctomycetaceae bacterium]|nr:hypothetical protein [Planctomycetaceae bacterium]